MIKKEKIEIMIDQGNMIGIGSAKEKENVIEIVEEIVKV